MVRLLRRLVHPRQDSPPRRLHISGQKAPTTFFSRHQVCATDQRAVATLNRSSSPFGSLDLIAVTTTVEPWRR